jgi:hypothetical protein
MPETGPVAGGLEPLDQALDIQVIGKYHRLLPNWKSYPIALRLTIYRNGERIRSR